ncbi:hypothetical protein NW762_012904 [Fusarium torreyae]|uniref:Ubiquitin-like protease family profile domain-containing protein n=1 Tax=Fusarium torreyae TaxID=1237075 RepID=A0A9W8RQC0_9HYPO|nr:hypothetical protein NW762_012904 [Fusarium torreyae]
MEANSTPRPTDPPGLGIDQALLDPALSQEAQGQGQGSTFISTTPASISQATSTSASEVSLPSTSASKPPALVLDKPQVLIAPDASRPPADHHEQAHQQVTPQQLQPQSPANLTDKSSTNEIRDKRLARHKQELDRDWGGRDNWARRPYVKSPDALGLNLVSYLRSLTNAALVTKVELSSLWEPNGELFEECNVFNKPQPLSQQRARRALDAFRKHNQNSGDNETDLDSNPFNTSEVADGDSTHDSPTSGPNHHTDHASFKRAGSPSDDKPRVRTHKRARCDGQDHTTSAEVAGSGPGTTTTCVASPLSYGMVESQSVGPYNLSDALIPNKLHQVSDATFGSLVNPIASSLVNSSASPSLNDTLASIPEMPPRRTTRHGSSPLLFNQLSPNASPGSHSLVPSDERLHPTQGSLANSLATDTAFDARFQHSIAVEEVELPGTNLTLQTQSKAAAQLSDPETRLTDDVLDCLAQSIKSMHGTGNDFVVDTCWLHLDLPDKWPSTLPRRPSQAANLYIPLHHLQLQHWSLALLHLEDEYATIVHFDPIDDSSRHEKVQEAFTKVFETALPGGQLRFESRDCPQQQDKVNCGVFVLAILTRLLENSKLPDDLDAKEERGRLLTCLPSHSQPPRPTSILGAISPSTAQAPFCHDGKEQNKNEPRLSLNALEKAGLICPFDQTRSDIDKRLTEARDRATPLKDLAEAFKFRPALFEPFNAIKTAYDQAQRALSESPDTVWDSAMEKHSWEGFMDQVQGICRAATCLFTADKCRGATSEATKEDLKAIEAQVKTLEQEKKREEAKRKL